MKNKDLLTSRLQISESYFTACEILIEKIMENGNKHVYVSDFEPKTESEKKQMYNVMTYNMENLALPLLLCLYQAIELIPKAFVLYKNDIRATHDSRKYLEKFEEFFPEQGQLIDCIKPYLGSYKYDFIIEYINENSINNMAEFYNSLRYPDVLKKDGKIIKYDKLKFPESINQTSELKANSINGFLSDIKEIKCDVDNIKKLSVLLWRQVIEKQ